MKFPRVDSLKPIVKVIAIWAAIRLPEFIGAFLNFEPPLVSVWGSFNAGFLFCYHLLPLDQMLRLIFCWIWLEPQVVQSRSCDALCMDYSISEMHRFECHRCGAPFDFQVWFVVDVAERPDLVAQIKTGSLHRAACPRCDEVFPLEGSLLLYRREMVPRLLFSPKAGETAPDIAQRYYAALKDRMGAAWRDEWLSHVGHVAREKLPHNIEFDMSRDPEAARKADLDLALQRLDCHRSLQNQPAGVESKPATLRCFIHIMFLDTSKGFSISSYPLSGGFYSLRC